MMPDATEIFQQALVLYQQGRLAQAQELCQRAMQRQAQHFGTLHLLGVIAAQAHDPRRAVEFIASALKIDPAHAGAHCNLGSALKALDQLDAALASYDRAIAIQPGLAQAHSNRGVVLYELKRFDAALESC